MNDNTNFIWLCAAISLEARFQQWLPKNSLRYEAMPSTLEFMRGLFVQLAVQEFKG